MEAFTKDGKFFAFKLSDVPINIDHQHFILANKENTPILKLGLCRRGCDIPDVYEGDILNCDGEEHVLQYQRGFILLNENRRRRYLWEFDNFKVVGNIYDTEWAFSINCAKSVRYRYNNTLLYPKSFAGYYKGKILLEGTNTKVSPRFIQQEACFTYEGEKIFFGDLIEGYPVELYYGRPVIKHDDIIHDVICNIELPKK